MENIWTILGLTFGAIGIVVAIYESRKYRGPIICYQHHGSNLIESYDAVFPETIEVLFGGEKVPNLTHSKIVLWNRGKSPIKGNDISATDPLSFYFDDDTQVLQAEVAKISKSSNQFLINYRPKDNSVSISFDFLDTSDGALLSIWHTARIAKPKLKGTLINSKAGPFDLGRFIGPRPNLPRFEKGDTLTDRFLSKVFKLFDSRLKYVPYFIIIIGIIFSLISVISLLRDGLGIGLEYLPEKISDNQVGLWYHIGPLLIGLFYIFIGFYINNLFRRRFPKNLLPNEYSAED